MTGQRYDPRAITGDDDNDGYVLTTVGGIPAWMPSSGGGIPPTLIDAKGDLIAGSAPDTAARLPVGTNGQVLTADSTQTLGMIWSTPASGGGFIDPSTTKGDLLARSAGALSRLAVGANGKVLTADSSQVLGMVWSSPASGVQSVVAGLGISVNNLDPLNPVITNNAGGGTAGFDRRWTIGPGESSIDEFNDASLAAAWVRVDAAGTSARAVYTEAADALSCLNTGGDAAAALHALMRPLSGAGGTIATTDAFVTCLSLLGAGSTPNRFGGLVIADGITHGAGNQIVVTAHKSATSAVNLILRPFTNYNTQGTVSTTILVDPGAPLYLRLVYMGSNNWRFDYSSDDITWLSGPTIAKTLTPTHVGMICSSWAEGSSSVATYEFFRRVTGIT